jgi:DNA-binding protein HU-beta
MDLFYKVKYLTRKAMLTVMGPAQLDGEQDPMHRLEKEKKERLGESEKPKKDYPKKRKFEDSGSAAAAKAPATPAKKAPAAKKTPAKKAPAAKKTPAKKAPASTNAETKSAEAKSAAKKAPAKKAEPKTKTTQTAPRKAPGS